MVARAPLRISDRYILDLVAARGPWIQAQIEKQRAQPLPPPLQTMWHAGEAVPFLGEPHILEKDYSAHDLKKWYLKQAKAILIERTDYFATEMNLYPRKVIVKNQKARWGSCSADNVIRFNWKVIQAPLELIDYLIVHELAHIQEKNHSRRFWDLVATHIKDPIASRKALQHFGRYVALDLADSTK